MYGGLWACSAALFMSWSIICSSLRQIVSLLGGAIIFFGVGVFDDFRRKDKQFFFMDFTLETQQTEYKKSFGKEVIISLVRDFLKDYPEVTLSVDEKGDFFRAELRINELPTTQVTPSVTPSVTPPVERVLFSCERDIGRGKMQKQLGIKNKKHFLE